MSARRIAGKAAVWGIAGIAAAGMALAASGIASADVTEEAPSPQVSSRQASVSSYQGTRNNAPNVARGQADTRLAGAGIVQAQGTVRDTPKAVVARPAAPFQGPWPIGAPMGDF
ncbi:MAG: hypothetical protein U0R77_01155 [Mycolicibacterium insubricum]|jgi:hypothetical protein|uniref:Uncharacterized protein n=1 Tax=Mycolicibacterium insubricum TaxID=444597 RepID=A0A1X0DLU1_9MYCO|nr:hypothetical protein [Mycolicibacterium insubricum]MCB9441930.1 hypothetical protein [Mycolicibacterium sp.]MCV7081024.1 hypothetical protein [Mycolicibacterium insubricum]ORA73132.1 hypothetical protein BST26_03650 [Mycolicibacterium insubricum]BBZ68542.1 hypothetical protein MINS_39710 [Mycolicibacterium insubricum]